MALEWARRYCAIAVLFKQTAAPRPPGKASLPDQAEDQVALAQLESYFWRAERQQPAW